ncbi:MAG TPA: hypothetical protein VKH20_10705 [Solirubrobacterales bacterium]|nr:hypothetical protein [Solirubrobacterales bacterium]
MRNLKALGLAMVVAAAFAASIGVASAGATVLCKTNAGAECGAEKYPVGTKLNTQLEIAQKFTLRSTSGPVEVECKESAMQIVIENAGSATTTVLGKVAAGSIVWGLCSAATTTVSGGVIEFHWIPGTFNATLTGKEISVKFVEPGTITCIYGFGAGMIHIGTFTGGLTPRIDLKAVAVKQAGSSALCQTDEIMEGEYEVQPNGEEKAMYAREK